MSSQKSLRMAWVIQTSQRSPKFLKSLHQEPEECPFKECSFGQMRKKRRPLGEINHQEPTHRAELGPVPLFIRAGDGAFNGI
ncbi:hypothetical protein DdX_13751 [Ditylenchus destructor]|uniref:Uncharacterized protein n=1 Tax=Ditylenchus destructor TaxID=166010 RepID=A0AAD4QZA6_9BILA|nr:hypothetical protein DdX_13751 [Ditylenchus destructor]